MARWSQLHSGHANIGFKTSHSCCVSFGRQKERISETQQEPGDFFFAKIDVNKRDNQNLGCKSLVLVVLLGTNNWNKSNRIPSVWSKFLADAVPFADVKPEFGCSQALRFKNFMVCDNPCKKCRWITREPIITQASSINYIPRYLMLIEMPTNDVWIPFKSHYLKELISCW